MYKDDDGRRHFTQDEKNKQSLAHLGNHYPKMSLAQKGHVSSKNGKKHGPQSHPRSDKGIKRGQSCLELKPRSYSSTRKTPSNKGVKRGPNPKLQGPNLKLRKYISSLSPEQRVIRNRQLADAREKSKYFNSRLELKFKEILDDHGFKENLHYIREKSFSYYRADFLFPDKKLVIEINGCWPHQCEQCGYNMPWKEGRHKHDAKKIKHIENKGYTVIVLWEHDFDLQNLLEICSLV